MTVPTLAHHGTLLRGDGFGTYAPTASPNFSGTVNITDNTSGAVTPIVQLNAFGRSWQVGIDTSNNGGGRSFFIAKFTQRHVDDLQVNGTINVTSASEAEFGPEDNGTAIADKAGNTQIPAGTTLIWVAGTDTATTARLSQAATATGTITATIGSNAAAVQDLFFFLDGGGSGSSLGIGITPPHGSHRLEVGGSDATPAMGGLRLRISSAQTADVLSVYDSSGAEHFFIDSASYLNNVNLRASSGSPGRVSSLFTNDLTNEWGWNLNGGGGAGALTLNYVTTNKDAAFFNTDGSVRIVQKLIVDSMTANSQLVVSAPSTGAIAMVLKRIASQTGGLLVVRDENNNLLYSLDSSGRPFLAKSTAPGAATSGGSLYVDASGNLHYRGPTTDTQLAAA